MPINFLEQFAAKHSMEHLPRVPCVVGSHSEVTSPAHLEERSLQDS